VLEVEEGRKGKPSLFKLPLGAYSFPCVLCRRIAKRGGPLLFGLPGFAPVAPRP
jgi:hypothetical protein